MKIKQIAKELLVNFSLEQVQIVLSLLPKRLRHEIVAAIWNEYHNFSV